MSTLSEITPRGISTTEFIGGAVFLIVNGALTIIGSWATGVRDPVAGAAIAIGGMFSAAWVVRAYIQARAAVKVAAINKG